jgi:alpha-galactosidase
MSLSMFRDMFFAEKLKGSTLTLVDTNPESLARMTELAGLLNKKSGAGLLSRRPGVQPRLREPGPELC